MNRGIWGPNGTRVVAAREQWEKPLKWNREAEKAGRIDKVFCGSLMDIFEDWQGEMVDHKGQPALVGFGINHERIKMAHCRSAVFDRIEDCYCLIFQLVTKRPENILRMWPAHGTRINNVWLITSVSDQATANVQVPHLLKARHLSPVLGLSCEPLLGPIDLSPWLDQLDLVIVGGESGPHARPMHPDWARSLRDQCQAAGVAFFYKQWGEWFPSGQEDLDNPKKLSGRREIYIDSRTGRISKTASPFERGCPCDHTAYEESMVLIGKKAAGRLLDGREWNEFPKGR